MSKSIHPTLTKRTIDSSDLENINQLMVRNMDLGVCGVISPTGSGKSTIMIKYFFEQGYRVFVVNPTVPSVENLVSTMTKQLGKENVGSAYEGKVNYKNWRLNHIRNKEPVPEDADDEKDTKVIYCTAGHMKKLFLDLVKYGNEKGFEGADMAFCDVLILDEAHNGSLDLEIIMTLWNEISSYGCELPFLLLTSATLDISKTIFPQAECYTIKIDSFPISIRYHTQSFPPDDPRIYKELATVLKLHHMQNTQYLEDGSIWLIFCAGSNEVDTVYKELLALKDPTLIIKSLYSSQAEKDDTIFLPQVAGGRKIIISTNIAETSITIEGVDAVYDTLVEKYAETSATGGFKLTLNYISKSSATQRAGRTGRTCPGYCYRMCTEPLFLTLTDQRPNEIMRVPLHSTVIELLDVKQDPIKLFKTLNVKRIKDSEDVLFDLKMITKKVHGGMAVVTNVGRFACLYPLSVTSSALLYAWSQYNYPLFVGIVMVSLIDCYNQSYFYYPKKQQMQSTSDYMSDINEIYHNNFQKYNHDNDLGVLSNMFNAIMTHIKCNINNKDKIREYNIENNLNNKKIFGLFDTITKVINIYLRGGYDIEVGKFNTEVMLKLFKPIVMDVYKSKFFTFYKKQMTLVYKKDNDDYILDRRLPLNKTKKIHQEVVGLIVSEIQNKLTGPPKRIISLCMPIT